MCTEFTEEERATLNIARAEVDRTLNQLAAAVSADDWKLANRLTSRTMDIMENLRDRLVPGYQPVVSPEGMPDATP